MSRSSHSVPLMRLIRRLGDGPLLGAEVGVWFGVNADIILQTMPNVSLHLIDSWDMGGGTTMQGRPLRDWEAAYRAAQGVADRYPDRTRLIRAFSVDAARCAADGSLDFVFIDADHGYDGIRDDVRLWWPKIRIGGLFSGHDYRHHKNKTGEFGVKRAVDEFAIECGHVVRLTRGSVWYWIKEKERCGLS